MAKFPTKTTHQTKAELAGNYLQLLDAYNDQQKGLQMQKAEIKSLQNALLKADAVVNKIRELIQFMQGAGFIDKDGKFIPPKKWKFWIWFSIAEFLIEWVPALIGVFKKQRQAWGK